MCSVNCSNGFRGRTGGCSKGGRLGSIAGVGVLYCCGRGEWCCEKDGALLGGCWIMYCAGVGVAACGFADATRKEDVYNC